MPQEISLSPPVPRPDATGRVVWAYEALCELYLEDTGRVPWANPGLRPASSAATQEQDWARYPEQAPSSLNLWIIRAGWGFRSHLFPPPNPSPLLLPLVSEVKTKAHKLKKYSSKSGQIWELRAIT